jgi:endonuclease G
LRIPREAQLGEDAYVDAAIDRGHMVRREDPNWGETMEIVSQANFDTFHYTNSSPQHSRLNRNGETWQGLENHILNSARTHGFRASVFTGPVFGDDDPVIPEFGVPVPLEYWKLVVMLVGDGAGGTRLHATAYLLSQGRLIQKLLQERDRTEAVEGFAFGAYKTYQISLAALAAGTGYSFGNLASFDPLAPTAESVGAGSEDIPFVEIGDLSRVVL